MSDDTASHQRLLEGRITFVRPRFREFYDLSIEWRRFVAEFVGTFLLLLAAAGAGVVNAASQGAIGRNAAVIAPALTVAAVILSMGQVSGAHLNPVVTVAFYLRREFPWKRIPGYFVAQMAGGLAAVAFLRLVFGAGDGTGAVVPMAHLGDWKATAVEAVLTLGLVGTILGTASGAQNVGALSAFGVAGYIALAGLWASPVTGAAMNPVRSLAPEIVGGNFAGFWIYLIGPFVGALIAVGIAQILRGGGGDPAAARAAQGSLGSLYLVQDVPGAPTATVAVPAGGTGEESRAALAETDPADP